MKDNGSKKETGQIHSKMKSIPMKIANKAMLSTCKIKIKEKNNEYLNNGTGFFMKVSNSLGCLITNYHVIGNDKVYEYIELEIWNNIKMKLDLSNRYKKFFNKPTDITIIEIKNTDIIYKDIEFLRYDSNYINGYDIYKNIDVFTIEYPFGEDLLKSIEKDSENRAKSAQKEIEFALKRENYCDEIISKLGSNDIPLRVTHNDTKLNNILMDPITGEGICIIDLDTVMPGSLLYDFGDSNRFGANTALEDETDLSKVSFSIDMFTAYTKGFLSEVSDTITECEASLLPFSCILMTFEVGIRFLTDYLEGDTYFKVTHPLHNLERAKNQFKLVEDIECKLDEMKNIVSNLRG